MGTTDLRWWKSARSGSGGQGNGCVEVATADGTWYVWDSKDPEAARSRSTVDSAVRSWRRYGRLANQLTDPLRPSSPPALRPR